MKIMAMKGLLWFLPCGRNSVSRCTCLLPYLPRRQTHGKTQGLGGGAEPWDPCHCHSPGCRPGPGVCWGESTGRAENISVGLGAPSSGEACPTPAPQGRGTTCRVQGGGSLGPGPGCSITGFPPHTADCSPCCYSRRGACLSAFLMLLLTALAALIALVAILGPPSRTPGQGGQERVGQTCWESRGSTERWGKLILPGFSTK